MDPKTIALASIAVLALVALGYLYVRKWQRHDFAVGSLWLNLDMHGQPHAGSGLVVVLDRNAAALDPTRAGSAVTVMIESTNAQDPVKTAIATSMGPYTGTIAAIVPDPTGARVVLTPVPPAILAAANNGNASFGLAVKGTLSVRGAAPAPPSA
jgi:hypothetical protein